MGGMKMEVTSFKLNNLVKETINFYGSQAELKNITIEDRIGDDIQIKADKNIVRLVMRNLLSNALKFTDNNGKVIISAIENENKVHIEVKDTGVGMDEDKLKKLFTDAHFTTADTNQKEGTGLGLLLCKEFLLKVDGDIWAESQVGIGTSFKVALPKN
jgi:signal transduction histidine kinase